MAEFKSQKGSAWEKIVKENKIPIIFLLLGIIFVGLAILVFKKEMFSSSSKIEVLETTSEGEMNKIIVEVSGGVEKPGVYSFKEGSRVEDALISAGGFSAGADRDWVEKYLNRAEKLTDGRKIYIPLVDRQSEVLSANKNGEYQNGSTDQGSGLTGLININTASLKELDSLPGIGPVYGQNIIEQRPYSTIEDLRTKDVIPQKTFEKIKDLITVY